MFTHYPKLSAIALTYLLVFGIFAAIGPMQVHYLVEPLGIGGIIVAGALYTYGFTASLGAVLLVALVPDYSPVLIALLGGVGATLADITIFKFLKGDLHHEIQKFGKITPVKFVLSSRLMRNRYVRDILGFITIASPLPDELGIAFISMTRMSMSTFRVVSFTANVLGIYVLAVAGGLVY